MKKVKISVGGAGIISLAAKMYCGFTEVTEPIKALTEDILNKTDNFTDNMLQVEKQKIKLSTKGCSKTQNKFTPLHFLKTLKTQREQMATNRGFMYRGKTLYYTEINKRGPDYLYKKRVVQNDGISTKMLPEPDEL